MEEIQDKVFGDFTPPPTTDGSYMGRKINSDATKKHYEMKFSEELTKVNLRLRSSKTKVSIEAKKGGIQLRATLPLKPDDLSKDGREKKQYTISLGIPANFEGLKTAEEESYELGRLIARKMFVWTDKYLGKQATKNRGITFREFYEQFEKRYFETRKRTLKSEGTIRGYLGVYRTHLFSDDVINPQNIRNLILEIKVPLARRNAIRVISLVAKMLKIEVVLSDLCLKHESKPRNIPLDIEIVKLVNNFQDRYEFHSPQNPKYKNNWMAYKLAYSLLAIYGLRPREILNKPDFDWLLSSENIQNTFKVHKDNKTGYREVLPFVPDWVELFDIKNTELITTFKEVLNNWETPAQLHLKAKLIANNFKKADIPFAPYDLRHACAIRAHLQGVPIKASADNLGHSVEMHTKVYQQWFGLENRRKAFDQTFEQLSEVDRLKHEIAQLKKQNAQLETELARFKLNQMI